MQSTIKERSIDVLAIQEKLDKKNIDILKSLSSVENLALGVMTGIVARPVIYPFQVWKNASQQSLPLSMNPLVIYRGLPASCLNFGSTTGLQFVLTGFYKKRFELIQTDKDTSRLLTQIGAPLCGGLTAGVPCSMMELFMIQQQRFGGSLNNVVSRIVDRFGAGAVMRGMSMTICREGLFAVAMLGLTPAIQQEIYDRFKVNKDVSLMIGSLVSSAFATTATHPLDTIKTCMQGDMCQRSYSNVTNTWSKLVRMHGVMNGLFRGIHWRFTQISIGFFTVNKLKEAIAPIAFQGHYDQIRATASK